MLNQYISTGFYVSLCSSPAVLPITGSGIYTSFLDQCDADGNAYNLAQINAQYLRSLNPCPSTGSYLYTGQGQPPVSGSGIFLNPSGIQFYDWTGYFKGEQNAYYDIIAWGDTLNGYLSGNLFSSHNYFTSMAGSDSQNSGIVLAVLKSGSVTGFGSNVSSMLNIPLLKDALQVSVGYDHCLVLRSGGQVTGWGNDQWNALSINSGITGAIKVCAGMGSSFILLNNGTITGTPTYEGIYPITIPPNLSGVIDISHINGTVLFVNSGGYISGFGADSYGITNYYLLNGISYIQNQNKRSTVVFNNGQVTGIGLHFPKNTIPSGINNILTSNVRVLLNTLFLNNQSIIQTNYYGQIVNTSPEPLNNNIVSIGQGNTFTAALFKRPVNINSTSVTGYNDLWKITSFSNGANSFGGLSIGNLYPPQSIVVQLCDGYGFVLPNITSIGQTYTQSHVTSCSAYGGFHNITFNSIRSQPPILNINYSNNLSPSQTGFAATGITNADYWNQITTSLTGNSGLYYNDGTLSPILGGYLIYSSGVTGGFGYPNNMYSTYIYGYSGSTLITQLTNIPSGNYNLYVYGHGSSGQYSNINVLQDNFIVGFGHTSYYTGWDSTTWKNGRQYTDTPITIPNSGNITIICSGYLNGLQLIQH